MAETVVIAGSIAQRPHIGGHTWVFLQYARGLRRLGFDVLLVDHLEPEMCHAAPGTPGLAAGADNVRYFLDVMERFDLAAGFALLSSRSDLRAGLSRARVIERVRESAFLLNVMGFLTDEEILAAADRRVFLDIDPGFGQMWQDLGLHDVFRGHNVFVTVGENIGRPSCAIPVCGKRWIHTRPPVVLDEWPACASSNGSFTTIATWRGPFGPINYQGQTYGLRVHEFRKFAALPRMAGRPFEVALDIDPADGADRDLLRGNGWTLAEPRAAAGDPWRYRSYIQQSRAEFVVAKNMYVRSNSGWFSDRSACYLASGKPVVAQDTGLANIYPAGRGLMTFSTLEEALDAVEAVDADYPRHCRAARELAEEYFDADKVLRRLAEAIHAA